MISDGIRYNPSEATAKIKEKALQLGFSACGIAKVRPLDEDSEYLDAWIRGGKSGRMGYLSNHTEKRNDPSVLFPGAKSVIVVLLNYASGRQPVANSFKVAKYAHGRDYHFVLKQFLGELHRFICDEITPAEGRPFCDSAPVFERRWAYEAGLGWIGLNHCLIHPRFGSFCFIAELIVDLELEYDSPLEGNCGQCCRCLKACPTKALEEGRAIDAKKCIAYLTIELKDEIPEQLQGKLGGSIAGCDRCQDVCPWNKHAAESISPLWEVDPELMQMTDEDWRKLDKSAFKAKFANSALTRLGYAKLRQNCSYIVDKERYR